MGGANHHCRFDTIVICLDSSRIFDLRVGFLARAEWTPAWLSRLNPEAELDFTVSFLRNRSTLSSANYSRWEGGPALVLGWRF